MRQPSIRRGVRTRLVIFGTLALLLILFSAFSAYLTPYDPYLQDLSQAKAPPSAEHLLGTDRYGRDMLSRVIVGSRTSIFSTLLLVAAVTVLGTAVGLCGGFLGGWADAVLRRVSDIVLASPGLVFALAVAGALLLLGVAPEDLGGTGNSGRGRNFLAPHVDEKQWTS